MLTINTKQRPLTPIEKFSMKTKASIILSIILLLLMTYSCKKDLIIFPMDIAGQWEWIKTYKVYLLSDSNPLTPQNTGIQEILVFNDNHTWFNTQNKIKTDSGTYTLGHGSYTPYIGAYTFIYDSIVYYQDGIQINGGWDYYSIYNDTLVFSPYYGGRFTSYSLPFNGSKYWIKK
jgi:hypothetical protein